MKKSLKEVWHSKIEAANLHNLTQFIFIYKLEYYISEWRKSKWTDPVKVRFL
jgi:hypothetical protein